MEDFVAGIHRQIEQYTAGHGAERTEVQIEFVDGLRVTLRSLAPEPGYGFVTLGVHGDEDGGADQIIVPVASIRRIAFGPAEADRSRFGFALPDDGRSRKKGADPAA